MVYRRRNSYQLRIAAWIVSLSRIPEERGFTTVAAMLSPLEYPFARSSKVYHFPSSDKNLRFYKLVKPLGEKRGLQPQTNAIVDSPAWRAWQAR